MPTNPPDQEPSDLDNDYLSAAAIGDLETVKRGLNEGCNRDVVDPETASTALDRAALHAHWEIVEHLIRAGAPVNEHRPDVHPILYALAAFAPLDLVALAINKGAPVDAETYSPATGKDGRETALYRAAKYGRSDVVALLCANGANTELAAAGDKRTPVYMARNGATVDALAGAGANMDAVDLTGCTPLLAAITGFRTSDVPERLIANGANLEAEFKGNRLVHAAATSGRLDVLVALLEAGADATAVSSAGRSLSELVETSSPLPGVRAVYDAYLARQAMATVLSERRSASARP